MFLSDYNIFIIFAFVISLVQCVSVFTPSIFSSHTALDRFIRTMAATQFVCVLISFFSLMYDFIISNFDVALVYKHSHSQMPLLYKAIAVWGNHEGSLLLWSVIASFYGLLVTIFSNLTPTFRVKVLAVLGGINALFYSLIIFTSNPFLLRDAESLNGMGLNPVLQDLSLVVHPPFLYFGYAGTSVAYAFAVVALFNNCCDKKWAYELRPWVLISWAFLTVGIALGSLWAYYELGWGGWWFWDPVENVALIPWLILTALIHCLSIMQKRGIFPLWCILLSMLTFILSIMGMFIVRSGILISVHSFAQDIKKGVFIMAILSIVTIFALAVFLLRSRSIHLKSYNTFSILSRESILLFNNIILVCAASCVLIGTLFPIFMEYALSEKVSVGAPYFNTVFPMFMIPLCILLPVGSIVTWRVSNAYYLMYRLLPVTCICLVIGVISFVIQHNLLNITLSLWVVPVGVTLSVWVCGGILEDIRKTIGIIRSQHGISTFKAFFHISCADAGRIIAHFGVVVTMLGISFVSAWDVEQTIPMKLGDNFTIRNYDVTLDSVTAHQSDNYVAILAKIQILENRLFGKHRTLVMPERRLYFPNNILTSEVGLNGGMWRDIYIILGERIQDGVWNIHVHIKPLVRWIWCGAFLMFIGACLGLVSHLLCSRRKCE